MALSVGIYVGTENIDLIALSGTRRNPRLVSFGRAKLPEQAHWRSRVRVEGPGPGSPRGEPTWEQVEPVRQTLEELLSRTGIPTRKVHIGIASESVIIRYFQMPTLPLHERRMAVAYEARKYLPFKLEELTTDQQVILRRNDPSIMRVMFFAVKQSTASVYHSLFHSLRLTPASLEPASVSLLRLARFNVQLRPQEVAALVLMERDSATITIAREDLLYLSRNISVAGQGEGAAAGSNDLMEALINETRVSIDYYRRRFLGEPPVTKILLFGAEDPTRIREAFSNLGILTEVGDPMRRVSGSKSGTPGMAAAVGLALRGIDRSGWNTNLLLPSQRRQSESLFKSFVWQVAAAMVFLGLWQTISHMNLRAAEQKIIEVRQGQVRISGVSEKLGPPQLRQLKAEAERERRLLSTISQERVLTCVLLAELSRIMPPETWARSIFLRNTFEQETAAAAPLRRALLRMAGHAYAQNRDLELQKINDLMEEMEKNPVIRQSFSNVALDSVQRTQIQGEEAADFRLSCSYDQRSQARKGGAP